MARQALVWCGKLQCDEAPYHGASFYVTFLYECMLHFVTYALCFTSMSHTKIRKVHQRNVEVFNEEFDAVKEQARLERLTGVSNLKVGIIVGQDLVYAMHGGKVGIFHDYKDDEQFNGCFLVQYRKGKLARSDGQIGEPRDYGPFLIRFYHPDRIAEILRLDLEEKA